MEDEMGVGEQSSQEVILQILDEGGGCWVEEHFRLDPLEGLPGADAPAEREELSDGCCCWEFGDTGGEGRRAGSGELGEGRTRSSRGSCSRREGTGSTGTPSGVKEEVAVGGSGRMG
jgi:hypothetical protein